MSIANDIAQAVSARLQNITVANGYQTDIGLRVLRGRRRLDPNQMPCAVVVERDDTVLEFQGQSREPRAKVRQPFVLEGHVECDPDNPNDAAHLIIADIKKAIFTERLTYGAEQKIVSVEYTGRSIAPREDGMSLVAAAVEITVEYVEHLANP